MLAGKTVRLYALWHLAQLNCKDIDPPGLSNGPSPRLKDRQNSLGRPVWFLGHSQTRFDSCGNNVRFG